MSHPDPVGRTSRSDKRASCRSGGSCPGNDRWAVGENPADCHESGELSFGVCLGLFAVNVGSSIFTVFLYVKKKGKKEMKNIARTLVLLMLAAVLLGSFTFGVCAADIVDEGTALG